MKGFKSQRKELLVLEKNKSSYSTGPRGLAVAVRVAVTSMVDILKTSPTPKCQTTAQAAGKEDRDILLLVLGLPWREISK